MALGRKKMALGCKIIALGWNVLSQVGFAEFNNTADNRANIGGTIIGAPIVGQ